MGGWVLGTKISYEFPSKCVPKSGKGGWVDPTWDKVLNSTVFFRHPLVSAINRHQ